MGLGYSSYFVSLFSKKVVNLDVKKDKSSIIKEVKIYNGDKIPYRDNFFDVVICIYTLHHAEKPNELLDELVRVYKDRVARIEESYSGLFSKLTLIYRDITVIYFSKQGVHIHFNNYFRIGELEKIINNKGYKIDLHIRKPKLLYYKEILVFRK